MHIWINTDCLFIPDIRNVRDCHKQHYINNFHYKRETKYFDPINKIQLFLSFYFILEQKGTIITNDFFFGKTSNVYV